MAPTVTGMSCANHSIYINGRNVNLAQFSVFAKMGDHWGHITDGRKLQAWLKEHGEDSAIISVLPLGARARDAEQGWVTQTSTKYLLGKGKQIANGKEDPLFHDLTTSRDGALTGLAVSTISARVKDGVFVTDEKVAKNWRKAQADAMLQFFEERISRGDSDDEAFADTLRYILGEQHPNVALPGLLAQDYGSYSPTEQRNVITNHRRALAELHQMVQDDTLQPALQLMIALASQQRDKGVAGILAPVKATTLPNAADVMKALREGANPVSPWVAARFLSHCVRTGGSGALSKEELASKEVRTALETLTGFAPVSPRLNIIDVVDVAGSICTNRRNHAVINGPNTWMTADTVTTGFEGLRAIHSIDISDVTQLLSLEPVHNRYEVSGSASIPAAEHSTLPEREIDPPARIVRAARALKAAQAALSHNTTAYGGRVVLDAADKIEELTNGTSITEAQRFLSDVLAKADPEQAQKKRQELERATSRARSVIFNILHGALPADRVDPDVIAEVGDYRKAVDEIVDAVLLDGDPATFLRAISSSRTNIELMRYSVASGYVPRKGGDIKDTAADIHRALQF